MSLHLCFMISQKMFQIPLATGYVFFIAICCLKVEKLALSEKYPDSVVGNCFPD